ncbi:GGDEF domain-containing protein [Marinobacter sp. DUT-1]|uniref:GGDEF domain-containing protein n=1 Tax=Marinobacter sp. DUT-1 TaxID=3412037 RepID=UPI003D170DC6
MFQRLRSDFRLSIITLLGLSGFLGITPFAVLRFHQGNPAAGLVDVLILCGLCAGVIYAWVTGDTRRSGLIMAIIAAIGAVVMAGLVGTPGLYWLYPCLITSFFLTSPRVATSINVAAVLLTVAQGGAFAGIEQMGSFVATALVVSACAFFFAIRNEDQRRRLEHLATIDPLTGVKNRRAMDEELAIAQAHASRTGLSCALILLDIDHFKKINDEHGHSVGDAVLVDLVNVLRKNTRKSDQLFRYGGEEFVLLLPDATGIKTVIGNLQQLLRNHVKHPGGSITASFGVAELDWGETVDSWLTRADDALYQAKETGRDRAVFAEPRIRAVSQSA